MRQLYPLLLISALAAASTGMAAETQGRGAGAAPASVTKPAAGQPSAAAPESGAQPQGTQSPEPASPSAAQTPPGTVQPAPGQVESAPPPQTGPVTPSPVPVQLPSRVSPAPSTEALPPKSVAWSFSGPFGIYDRASLQRGYQIYKEVCSACHALTHVAFRNLGDPGGPEFSPDEVKAIAASYKVASGPNEKGQTVDANGMPLTRPGAPADYFPPPFPNEQAARAANNGALPVIDRQGPGGEPELRLFDPDRVRPNAACERKDRRRALLQSVFSAAPDCDAAAADQWISDICRWDAEYRGSGSP